MHGTGVPLLTPFDDEGDLREDDLRELVAWVEDRGVDFIVPCGSNSEAELMSVEERNRVTEIVADEATVPVLAGTGHPGLRETLRQTNLAAEAGADAALVITPFYFGHDDATLANYYRTVAEESPVPVYLYSVPVFTDVVLSPEVVGELADHDNIAGMKDSSGNLTRLQRERARTEDADFDLLVGSGNIFAAGLDAGADGGVLALANVAPERASEIYRLQQGGHGAQARQLNARLVELNRAITAEYGVPGAKAVMQARGAPAGAPRRPHRPVSDEVRDELAELAQAAEQ
ncbi:dihydrodipicolinate synthase family protein [Haladaptatus pallidirubidus]|uniref:Dihydrodipicolinate synthase family protein n=1 Tax=Haladaptatus pallidirubidus TaxID=1008152 RepID=A0AAV3UEP0_9EURY|nr:dihydrodipicolinate synthase family protein [Haladaptatus pallidirubidus]